MDFDILGEGGAGGGVLAPVSIGFRGRTIFINSIRFSSMLIVCCHFAMIDSERVDMQVSEFVLSLEE